MKKTYLEPKMEVVRLKMESLMTTLSNGGDTDPVNDVEGSSRQGRGFFGGDE